MHGCQHKQNPEAAETYDSHYHRGDRFSVSAKIAAQTFQKYIKEIQRKCHLDDGDCPCNYRRIFCKNVEKYGSRQHQQDACRKNRRRTAQHTDPVSLPDPLRFPGAVILPHKGHHRLTHGKDRQIEYHLCPEINRKCRDGRHPQSIDLGLYQNVGKGDDDGLNAGRNANLQYVFKFPGLKSGF